MSNGSREKWLNGWPRNGTGVLIGSSVHCAGCGRYRGTTCIALTGEEFPREMPAWPFDEETCPIHNQPAPEPEPVDRLTQRALLLKSRDR